jgi:YYY domain-containing protein
MTSSRSHSDLRPGVANLLLVIILVAGFLLRAWNVNFDQGIGSHPDERSTSCFYATTIRLPDSWEQFLDSQQSPLNPLWDLNRQERRSFTYGHFPLYLGVALGEVFHWLAPLAEQLGLPEDATALMARAHEACDAIAVAGRLTIALLDTFTILLLYWLGRRIYSRAGGLLAAAFYAFTAQAVQLSHFFAMDPASTTFTVMAVLGGAIMVQDRSWRGAIVSGVGAGLAVASKFSALPILAAPVVAGLVVLYDEWQRGRQGAPADGRAQFRALLGSPTALVIAGLVFTVASPYAILDWRNFLQATLIEQGRMVRGIADMPFTRQYRNTTPYLYFIQQQLQWGMGWALGLVAAAGTAWAGVRLTVALYRGVASLVGDKVRPVSRPVLCELVVWSWLIPYFGLTGVFLAKFNRYMSPVLPFVLLFGAGLIIWLWRRGAPQLAESSAGQSGTGDVLDVRVDETLVVGEVAADMTPAPDGAASPATIARRPSALWRTLAVALAVVGVLGGLLWSLAYVNGVYNREHTWIAASRWIYQNVPRDSVILWELWDDPLPKAILGEPGMDMGSTGLRNIDWSPYEEDTAEKYEIMKQKLREADYVAYSSKRIYDSVDELPARYPMTNLYYQAMWDGRLGFELAHEETSPPELFGFAFDDRHADESWSLYDHPQVTIFRKVRDLSDAEYDALFDRAWEGAIPWDRGEGTALAPLLSLVGLGQTEESADRGLINRLIGLATGENAPGPQTPPPADALMLDAPLRELPVVDNYRWNEQVSESTILAVLWWWLALALLGWLLWPVAFALLRPLRDRGYLFSRSLGWLVSAWLLWIAASFGWLHNTVVNAWLMVGALAVVGVTAAVIQRRTLGTFLAENWGLLLAGEVLFGVAYLTFVVVRLFNPDLWQPWFGGEKFMEFAFLNGILRSPTFPPVDPHFAGGFINYYYFGLYLVAYLVKLTGVYAEVAFNLAIPTLFALTVINSFGVAYSAARQTATQRTQLPARLAARRAAAKEPPPVESGGTDDLSAPEAEDDGGDSDSNNSQLTIDHSPSTIPPAPSWRAGFLAALLAPFFVVIIGNLDGAGQLLRNLANLSTSPFQSSLPGLQTAVRAVDGLRMVVANGASLPAYDFWGPSRVIPATINEFPYWSFLFADLHPHLIGIPFAALFLGVLLVLVRSGAQDWRRSGWYGVGLLLTFALLLGALASVNLWELPTYWGLGVLGFLLSQYWGRGRVDWLFTIVATVLFAGLAYLLYAPFFMNYTNIGASGVGLVRSGDEAGLWLAIWGFFGFVVLSWLFWAAAQPGRPALDENGVRIAPSGVERVLSLALRQFERLPRLADLHQRLVQRPSVSYLFCVSLPLLSIVLALAAFWWGRAILALCLLPLALAFLLLWRRGRAADAGSQLAALLAAAGLAILAGTQVAYLKDFLQGGDWYRMNTLFKFFSQVWVLWGVAVAVALPRLWHGWVRSGSVTGWTRAWRWAWLAVFVILLAGSLAYLVFGTPARLDQRMVGWRPPIGTLDGMEYMREGSYTWPDQSHTIELRHDWEAIEWLLAMVRGNAVIAESSEVDYYRAGSSRAASMTGLSALRGMHESEQRYGEQLGPRDGLHREFWSTPDIGRMRQLMEELQIDLIYVGQLERHLHPDAVERLAQMAKAGQLETLFANDRTTIYAAPGQFVEANDGTLRPMKESD